MIPVTVEHVLSSNSSFVIGLAIGASILGLSILNFNDFVPGWIKLFGSVFPLGLLLVTVTWVVEPVLAPNEFKTITYHPTSSQISTFLEEEYGVSVNDENSLSYKGLQVESGFEMAVDGQYQECKFVSTGTPSAEGYPAVVACSVNSSGTWDLLPTRESVR